MCDIQDKEYVSGRCVIFGWMMTGIIFDLLVCHCVCDFCTSLVFVMNLVCL